MNRKDVDRTITVYADYVCPFCYLGRESLEQYQETRDKELEVEWRPFDLRSRKRGPDGKIDHSVDDGKDDEYYEQAKQNVRRLQERYDVEMARELVTDVDSLDAQVASYFVQQNYPYDKWLEFDRAIYEALWQQGRDIGDEEVLVDLAEDAGIDGNEIRSALDDATLYAEVRERFTEAQHRGITSVPTFVYDEQAARGAVPPEQLHRLVGGV